VGKELLVVPTWDFDIKWVSFCCQWSGVEVAFELLCFFKNPIETYLKLDRQMASQSSVEGLIPDSTK
jgi:hypothetical protein